MSRKAILLALLWPGLIVMLLLPFVAWAQENEPTPEPTGTTPIPLVHTVQAGENLTIIAQNYGVTVEELQTLNDLAPDALLQVGQTIIVPGGSGETIATVYTIQAGDTLAGIAARFNTDVTAVAATNRLITPDPALVVGDSLPVISRTGSALPQPVTGKPHLVTDGEGLLAVAARYGLSPAAVASANGLGVTDYLFPNQRLRLPATDEYRFLPGEWVEVRVRPLPIIQGSTTSIYVKNLLDGVPMGQFAGQSLHFVPYEDGYIGLVGLDAFTETGTYTLELTGSGNRPWSPLRQVMRVESGNYGEQHITIPQELSHLLAPEVRQNEDAFLSTIYTQFSDTPYWDALFQMPVTTTIVTAPYGDARSYNGGPMEIFHTGVDFGGAVGTPILAPANGVVVFNDALELRGNTVIIDHGLGVMSAYFHLSESFVAVGEEVTTGQTIAAGGDTGLSNGPHLHWDLRVLDVPVNPLQWTRDPFP